MCAILGAAWIVAQSMSRSRSHTEEFQAKLVESIQKTIATLASSKENPRYDARLEEGDRRMEDFSRQLENLQVGKAKLREDLAVQTHSLNNLKLRFEGINHTLDALREKIDEMPEKIVRLLRGVSGQ